MGGEAEADAAVVEQRGKLVALHLQIDVHGRFLHHSPVLRGENVQARPLLAPGEELARVELQVVDATAEPRWVVQWRRRGRRRGRRVVVGDISLSRPQQQRYEQRC